MLRSDHRGLRNRDLKFGWVVGVQCKGHNKLSTCQLRNIHTRLLHSRHCALCHKDILKDKKSVIMTEGFRSGEWRTLTYLHTTTMKVLWGLWMPELVLYGIIELALLD